jgi:phosphoribosylformylglycinamidine cyclo-ligase
LTAADDAKNRIKALVDSSRTALSRGLSGAFGGMLKLPDDVANPTLVMSTDGVGTKVLVAVRAGRYDTVGEDLVNHCVNDILVHGARPIGFLDYLAHADLTAERLASVVAGVSRGCRAHSMPLVGGETAQMPSMYGAGHFDLAGTIVGVVDEAKALHGERVKVGDALVGYASNGLHTNGYSLARKIVFDDLGLAAPDEVTDLGETVQGALLHVHQSYWGAIAPVLEQIHALAHITGGGIPGNLARSLPDGMGARVERQSWEVPKIFTWLQRVGKVEAAEMFDVFNMGIGMIAVVSAPEVGSIRAVAAKAGIETSVIGEVVEGEGVEIA